MAQPIYVPGTEETDPKKQNMSLQQIGAAADTLTASVATNTAAIAANTAAILPAATQANQETATSNTVSVTPGVQRYHPAHPKAWAYVTQSAGTYTLAASYGVTSITKAAVGRIDVTLSTAFSSVNYAAVSSCAESGGFTCEVAGSRTASNCRINGKLPTTNADVDVGFHVAFYGDQ